MDRHSKNPLITPADVTPSLPGRKVDCVFNAGVTECDGEIVLLLRVAESVINSDPQQRVVPLLEKPMRAGYRPPRVLIVGMNAMISAIRG